MRQRCIGFLDANRHTGDKRRLVQTLNDALSHVLQQSNGRRGMEHNRIDGGLHIGVIDGILQFSDGPHAFKVHPDREHKRLIGLVFMVKIPVSSHDFVALEANTPVHGIASGLVALVHPNEVVTELCFDRFRHRLEGGTPNHVLKGLDHPTLAKPT